MQFKHCVRDLFPQILNISQCLSEFTNLCLVETSQEMGKSKTQTKTREETRGYPRESEQYHINSKLQVGCDIAF